MRPLIFLLVASLGFAFAGCESGGALPDRMRDRFNAPQPKTQTIEGDQKVVFEAAQSALRRLDFQISRSGLAQGIVNGHSRLQAAASFGKARQYTLEIRLHSYEPGKTAVSAVLREQEESSSFAGATDLPIREHGLYSSFFAALEQALKEPTGSSPKPAKAP